MAPAAIPRYGTVGHMRATLVFREKYRPDDGAIVEMAIWRVPEAVAGSRHEFKYRLYFGKGGKRLAACDNERGKGNHRHVLGREHVYMFTSPESLITDFLRDAESARMKS